MILAVAMKRKKIQSCRKFIRVLQIDGALKEKKNQGMSKVQTFERGIARGSQK